MSSINKAPVPIPLKYRLREFRIRLLPVITFLLAGIAVYILWESRVQTPDFSGRAVGDVVTVLAPADGYLTDISAGPFASVEQGQRLFTLNRSLPGELESRLAFSEAAIRHTGSSYKPEPAHRPAPELCGLSEPAARPARSGAGAGRK